MRWYSLFCFATVLSANVIRAEPNITIAPLDPSIAAVVTVSELSDPAVRASVEAWFPPQALPAFKPALPNSIVLRNNGTVPVVAAAVSVVVTDAGGRAITATQSWYDVPPANENDFLLGPGQSMLVMADSRYTREARHFRTLKGSLSPYEAARLEGLMERTSRNPGNYNSTAGITFIVDSIVLADGKFIGPDRQKHFAGLSARVASQAAMARAILTFEGRDTDELQRYLATVAATSHTPLDSDRPPAQLARSYQAVLRNRGAEAVFNVARQDLQEATEFSIHR